MSASMEKVIKRLQEFRLDESDNLSLYPSGEITDVDNIDINGVSITRFTNEFWTARQRQASSIHEISFRACFKAQLPRFFIKMLTKPGDIVYDPFSGRGTTVIEAALLGRNVIANDVNPLSTILAYPRIFLPGKELYAKIDSLPVDQSLSADIDLAMFFHPQTEAELVSLKYYLAGRRASGIEDNDDRWIRMVATNRLTGHSRGFFSVYTLPPNQAVSPESQEKINLKRNQRPEYRDIKKILKRKTTSLIKSLETKEMFNLRGASKSALFLENDARYTPEIGDGQVSLTVTSPPFLDVVQYSKDNWLRCWFNEIDIASVEKKITILKNIMQWSAVMGEVFAELYRITRKGGWVAFEVGEVRRGKVNLEEYVIPLGLAAGFECPAVIVNSQKFTKTSNIWGIKNNVSGTNSNRIVLFCKG